MISLEQVRQLDIRVKKAVTAVKHLSTENTALRERVAELEAQLDELNREATVRQADEQELEVSLQGVLDVLDEVNEETAEVEPEPPADNYTIETVEDSEDTAPDGVEDDDMTPEDDGVGSDEDEGSNTEPSVAEDAVDEAENDESASVPNAPSDFDATIIEEPAGEETTESPETSPTAETIAVADEVPGVGQIVEFEQSDDDKAVRSDDPEESIPAETGKKPPVDDNSRAADDDTEDIDLTEGNDTVESTGDDDQFQSEFDIF